MVSVGDGYIWPNLTIFSDGLRTALLSHPSSRPDAKPFRYVGANPCILPSSAFEAAIDAFIPQVLGRLRDSGITKTNLDRIWRDVLAERSDPDAALRRKFEALLGADPDDGDLGTIEQLVRDADDLGRNSISELAADHRPERAVTGADTLRRIAHSAGFDTSRDIPRLAPGATPPVRADVPAWLLGARVAQALRKQLDLGSNPISNTALAELAGVSADALAGDVRGSDLSFVLDEDKSGCRMVLRSRWRTGRRFELARLLGDRLMNSAHEKLFPATRSHTFRQKAQRSFAAEFLAPFEEINARLDGDFSEENRQDVAESFEVSELTIRTLLVNRHRLERDDLDEALEVSVT
jgi:Zn-dependent peptidase ImmA (M78 family)